MANAGPDKGLAMTPIVTNRAACDDRLVQSGPTGCDYDTPPILSGNGACGEVRAREVMCHLKEGGGCFRGNRAARPFTFRRC